MPTRILVAEDDVEMCRLLAWTLEQDGYLVTEVHTGVGLLEHIRRAMTPHAAPHEVPDLVVSDMRMPGRSGLEILAAMRRLDAPIPFILISAFASPELHEEAARLGAAAVFDKPFDLDRLRDAVRALRRPV